MQLDPTQEHICRVIDRRYRDQAVVLRLQGELEARIVVRLVWTGNRVVSNPTFQGVIIDDDDRDDWEAARRLAEQAMERD